MRIAQPHTDKKKVGLPHTTECPLRGQRCPKSTRDAARPEGNGERNQTRTRTKEKRTKDRERTFEWIRDRVIQAWDEHTELDKGGLQAPGTEKM